jgi:diacylglycerol kinase
MVQFFDLVTIAGFYFGISATEWLFKLAIGFVMSIEGLNTAVEKNRFYSPTYHENWFHKDIAAGAVFFCSNSNNYRFNHIRAPNFFGNSTTYNQEWRKQQKKNL